MHEIQECPSCFKRVRIPDNAFDGEMLSCPHCKQDIMVVYSGRYPHLEKMWKKIADKD